jgi:hypothetical protein
MLFEEVVMNTPKMLHHPSLVFGGQAAGDGGCERVVVALIGTLQYTNPIVK